MSNTMDYYYSPEGLNNGFYRALDHRKQTDYVEFLWKKYFDTEPSEFQLRYISRQQGKSTAILQIAVMVANGLLPGNSHQYVITRSHPSTDVYRGMIRSIIDGMKGEKFIIVSETSNEIKFKSGGLITFHVDKNDYDYATADVVFMDW